MTSSQGARSQGAGPDQAGEPGPPGAATAGGVGQVPQQSPSGGAFGESATGYVTIGGPQRERSGRPDGGLDVFGSVWPAVLAAGLGSLVLGVILLVWPKATLVVVAILIGAALIVAGLLQLMHGFTAEGATGGSRVGSVVIGLLAIIVGLYCIRHYHVTIAVLAVVVGLFWVMHGIAEIAAGLIGARGPARWLTGLAGLLSLVAGLLVLFWPTISITVLVAVMGIWLIIYGILMMATAVMLRRSAAADDEAAEPGRLATA